MANLKAGATLSPAALACIARSDCFRNRADTAEHAGASASGPEEQNPGEAREPPTLRGDPAPEVEYAIAEDFQRWDTSAGSGLPRMED